MLVMDFASRNQLIQRSGRAGRVGRDGKVYVLLPKSLVTSLPQEHVPEIQRIPLSKVVLDVKQLDMGSPKELLSLAMDPPGKENLLKTILSLKELRALQAKKASSPAMPGTCRGRRSAACGQATLYSAASTVVRQVSGWLGKTRSVACPWGLPLNNGRGVAHTSMERP